MRGAANHDLLRLCQVKYGALENELNVYSGPLFRLLAENSAVRRHLLTSKFARKRPNFRLF